ncbi:MAG: CpsB/CapC family capsule biosynthesis tyrosine phosphatase [Bacteroidales bacterium]|nr:CpsB/CapC family capsule biosynthesis tyrosine phosphatase [Bacteroidales bacterium]
MFNFFHRNKEPKPCMSVLNTDMHCHLIPHVDDGSKGDDESLECLKTLQQLGYNKVYITPHFNFPRYPNEESDIVERFERLQKTVEQRRKEWGLTIELAGIAGEYRVDDGFAEKTRNKSFLTIAGKYVLIELSLHQHRMGLAETIFDVQMKGYEIILAHPERYPYFSPHSEELEELKNAGVYFQLNFLSLSGFYGDGAQNRAMGLLKNGWIDFLGSDMHNAVYAQAARDASNNKKLKKVLEDYSFMNSSL